MHFALISFLNARPLWWGLVHGNRSADDTFELTSPARCADLIADGAADLGLIPAIELERLSDIVAIPSICIASETEVRSVLMVSKVPFEEIRSVGLDPGSRTSLALARILLGERLGAGVYQRIKFDSIERPALLKLEGHDAAVVIGDPALQMSKSGSPGTFRYDLASEWYRMFGEPFVFGLWAGRRSALERVDGRELLDRLVASRAYGLSHLDRIAREASEELGLPLGELIEYFGSALHYDFGEREARALARFYSLARKYSLIEGQKEIEWLIDPRFTPS
ncbi:MAG TPA: menaquinone biosynthesis protein [Thermoanaerobaculia bacterium]|nr:menaquinone biosynthesis protein [Thermoanaerobaculia bacterium]